MMIALWLIAALTYLCFVQSQSESSCNTPDGKTGSCISILDCESIRTMANKPGKTQDEINFLMSSKCGFNDFPKVCCPDQALPNSCFTPENNPGKCTNIFNCAHIRKRLESPAVTQQEKDYVNSLRCSGPGFSVCCAVSDKWTSSSTPQDPKTEGCGRSASPPSKLAASNGSATEIDEYPWMALIEYKTSTQMFSGVLISDRYVLTASHCVSPRVVKAIGEPTNIRLGEYDISNAGRDCVIPVGAGEGELDCNDDLVVVPIESVTMHPDYNPPESPKKNDIALIRLTRIVEYTDFIRPICLPTTDVTLNFKPNETLYVAGWGALNEKIQRSNVKQHVDVTYKGLEACQQDYSPTYGRSAKLWSTQICAGGNDGKGACKGDSGGPLMLFNETYYQLVGIVSFGPVLCGDKVPGVYTKVFEYLTWIYSNMQP